MVYPVASSQIEIVSSYLNFVETTKAFGAKLKNSALHITLRRMVRLKELSKFWKNMLRACILDFQGSCADWLPLVEFSYNNSYQATIGMTTFEALYGRRCRTTFCWSDIGESLVIRPKMIQETTNKI